MGIVDTMEGIRYGFELMVYFAGLVVVAAIMGLVGFVLISLESIFILFGALFFIAAFLMVYAGMMGVLYKVIADAMYYAQNQAD